jgi:hypothetical protein
MVYKGLDRFEEALFDLLEDFLSFGFIVLARHGVSGFQHFDARPFESGVSHHLGKPLFDQAP